MFDRNGCGDDASREEIQHDVERDLEENGWRGRSKVVVIDPELEPWIWNASNRISVMLGWNGGGYKDMKASLVDQGLWLANSSKPEEPKRAMRAVLRKGQRHASSKLFGDLAGSITLRGCRDPAFNDIN